MPGQNDFFGQYLQAYGVTPQSVSAEKQQNVALKSAEKQAELRRMSDPEQVYVAIAGRENGLGYDSASEVEKDVRNLSPFELETKYGSAAKDLLAARAAGDTRYRAPLRNERSPTQALGDFTIGVAQGAATGLGAIGAFGAGLINDKAGVRASQMLQNFSNSMNQTKSSILQGNQENIAAAANQARRDRLAERKKGGKEDFVSKMQDLGEDILTTGALTLGNSAAASDLIAQAAGSLATVGPISKPLVAGEKALQTGLGLATRGSVAAGEWAAMPATIALQEASGAYQQTANEAYDTLADRGDLTEDQKIARASAAGRKAAAITAPVAALTGSLVSKFEADPLHAPASKFIQNAVKEAVEEGVQSGAGQIAQNKAIQEYADPSRDLLEGVGEQIAQGAIGGFGSAGAIAAPGAVTEGLTSSASEVADGAAKGVSKAAKAIKPAVDRTMRGVASGFDQISKTSEPLLTKIQNRADQIREANKTASPVSNDKVQTALKSVIDLGRSAKDTVLSAFRASDEDPEVVDHAENLLKTVEFNPETELDEDTPPVIQEALAGATNRFEAISRLADVIKNTEEGSDDQLTAARYLEEMDTGAENALESNLLSSLENIPDDHPIKSIINAGEDALIKLRDNPTVKKAGELAHKAFEAVKGIVPVKAEELGTPAAQRKIEDTIAIARNAPEKSTIEANDAILEHASQGLIQLTPDQQAALLSSSAIIQAEREFQEAQKEKGLDNLQNVVTGQAITNKDGNQPRNQYSLAEHSRRILKAYRGGDKEVAAANLKDLLMFAQHYQNKVEALNGSALEGDGTSATGKYYKALMPDRSWKPSAKPLVVNKAKEGSIRFAQQVAKEAGIVGKTANDFTKIFPDLEQQPISLVSLDPSLQGDAIRIAKEYRDGRANRQSVQEANEPTEAGVGTDTTSKSEPGSQAEKGKTEPKAGAGTGTSDGTGEATKAASKPSIKAGNDNDRGANDNQPASREDEEADRRADLDTARKAGSLAARQGKREAPPKEFSAEQQLEWYRARDAEQAAMESERSSESNTAKPEPETAEPAGEEPEQVREVEDTPEPEPVAVPGSTGPAFFRNLIGVGRNGAVRNLFTRSFEYSKKQISNLSGSYNPVTYVQEILGSTSYLNSQIANPEYAARLTPQVVSAYEDYLGNAETLRATLEKRLQNFLKQPYSKKDERSNLEVLQSEGLLNRFERGRVLNLTEQDGDNLHYNDELVGGAIMAALQWHLLSDRFKTRFDIEGIENLLGLSDEEQDINSAARLMVMQNGELLRAEFSRGLTLTAASRSLAKMIRSYWGVTAKPSGSVADIEGIPEAMAKELISALIDNGAIAQSEPVVDLFGKSAKVKPGTEKTATEGLGLKSPILLIPARFPTGSPLNTVPDLIDHLALSEPENVLHIGEAPSQVANTQLNNSKAKLTGQQRAAIRARQNVPYHANETMLGFFQKLGLDGVLTAFAGGDLSQESRFNNRHGKTLEGRNITFKSAFEMMEDVAAQLASSAEAAGKAISDIPMFFEYAFTKVNRLQMMGTNNPQASKLMREVLLPTNAEIDLLDKTSNAYKGWMIAVGQHIGVKIELQSHDATIEAVNKALASSLSGSIQGLRSYLQDGVIPDDLVETMKAELGGNMSPAAVHAMMDVARYQNASAEERAKFKTSLYLEADGKTNGPINAMALFSPGEFTPEWLENMRRGGLFIGSNQSMNSYASSSDFSGDLYQATTNRLTDYMADALANADPEVADHVGHLMTVLSTFLGKDVSFEDGALKFERGIAKNPLTVTLYGAGEKGIANKISNVLADAMYERMTDVLQRQAANPGLSLADALFPGSVDAAQKLNALEVSLGRILDPMGEKIKLSPKTFDISGNSLMFLRGSLLDFLVKPMRKAIEQTVGTPLTYTLDAIRRATQSQSIALKYAFRHKIDEMIAEKEKSDPTYRRTDFLTRAELEKAWSSLSALAPIIQTGSQNFVLGNSERADTADMDFSRTLDGKFSTPGYVEAPDDIGVSGIPSMVIGSADGMMMQIFASDADGPGRTIDVFDGLNMPIDEIENYSRRINEAVSRAWNNNPLRALSKSYAEFAENVDLDEFDANELKDIAGSMFGAGENRKNLTKTQLKTKIEKLSKNLNTLANMMEARQYALSKVNLSVDQMAGGDAPFIQEGSISLAGMDENQILQKLNELYSEKLSQLEDIQVKAEQSGLDPVVIESSEEHGPSGARVIDPRSLKVLARKLKASGWQMHILDDMIRGLRNSGYKIVAGSATQLRLYANAERLPAGQFDSLTDRSVNGVTIPSRQTIMLVNPTAEVLVHEMIHAATFDTVQAYYSDQTVSIEQQRAIQRLEALMRQFLTLGSEKLPDGAQEAFFNASGAIDEHLSAGRNAEALNEFMAWGLANQDLAKVQSKIEANPVARLAKQIVQGIKQLIWGKKSVSPVLGDMLTNLRFNTNILAQTQLNARTEFADVMLYHSQSYGNDERLGKINRIINRAVVSQLKKRAKGAKTEADRQQIKAGLKKLASSSNLVNQAIAHGFSMTPQQKTTFQTITIALGSLMELDPNALAKAGDLYSHFTKTINFTDFMEYPNSVETSDTTPALEKYNLVMGDFGERFDIQGRSSLLPMFLGLAVVHPDMRRVLANMPLPEGLRNKDGTLDAFLENSALDGMEKLGNLVSGTSGNAENVQQVVDQLTDRILKTALDSKSAMDVLGGQAQGVLDRLNDIVVSGMQGLSEAALDKAEAVRESTDSKWVKTAAGAVRVMAGVVNERISDELSSEVMAAANSMPKLPQSIFDLLNDIIGRTESNASIYDLIKRVRTLVQQARQVYREHVPQIIAKQFSRDLTTEEWKHLYRGMGKTDLAALRGIYSQSEVLDLLAQSGKLSGEIDKLEGQIQKIQPRAYRDLLRKSQQLAYFMMNGQPGINLLRNAKAVSLLLGENVPKGYTPTGNQEEILDHLTTMYAIDQLSEAERNTLAQFAENEKQGMGFALSYLQGQRKTEMENVQGMADLNHYKGFIPSDQTANGSLIIAKDTDAPELFEKSYSRIGSYTGSNLERNPGSKSYYWAPVTAKAGYAQGIMQTAQVTAGGIDLMTGLSHGRQALGAITNEVAVKRIYRNRHGESAVENLMPVWDQNGHIAAYERSVSPEMLTKLKFEQNLAVAMGKWRGRQVEEHMGQEVNNLLIKRLHEMYERDIGQSSTNEDQYVDLFNSKDPVHKDIIETLPGHTIQMIAQTFGNRFMVRRDMINDALGYRDPSVRNVWDQSSRWNPKVLQVARDAVVSVFGNKGYKYLVHSERFLQEAIADARKMIVVKSIIVPAANLTWNIFQLASRGVPLGSVAKTFPRKVDEINTYLRTRDRRIEAEAELRAAEGSNNIVAQRKLKAELQHIDDQHRRLSIWPLIDAGEFSSISDGMLPGEDLSEQSQISKYFSNLADKLPQGVKTAAKYGYIAQDTALFKGLQRSVEYGDFLAKATLFDYLTKTKGETAEKALASITEEFINYDRLPGRARGYAEKMGILWFWNFKIRSTKVALSMIRNNPVHSLLALNTPFPDIFGPVGSPLTDNMPVVLGQNREWWSIGANMGLHAHELNPWFNLVT